MAESPLFDDREVASLQEAIDSLSSVDCFAIEAHSVEWQEMLQHVSVLDDVLRIHDQAQYQTLLLLRGHLEALHPHEHMTHDIRTEVHELLARLVGDLIIAWGDQLQRPHKTLSLDGIPPMMGTGKSRTHVVSQYHPRT